LVVLVATAFLVVSASPLQAAGRHPGAAQASGASAPMRAVGTVKAISGTTLTIAPDHGDVISAEVPDTARILQMQPGSMDLKTATPATLQNISVGDRVLVRLRPGDAPNSLMAPIVIVMKQADIQQHQQQEEVDWQKRGVGGLVSSVDTSNNTITLSTQSAAGSGKLILEVSPKTTFRRYAADSVEFKDSKPSAFAGVHPGDQLRARGTKNAAGTEMAAEEIVSGTFRNVAGTVESVDAANNTLKVRDLATRKTRTITVTSNTTLHKLPDHMAEMFAKRFKGEAKAAQQEANASNAKAAQEQPGSASMGLSQAISRTPVIMLKDLKKGDAVMIVATQNEGASQETAITVLAGVEPILSATPRNSGPASLSAWGLGANMPADQQ